MAVAPENQQQPPWTLPIICSGYKVDAYSNIIGYEVGLDTLSRLVRSKQRAAWVGP